MKIICFGDSLTFGYQVTREPAAKNMSTIVDRSRANGGQGHHIFEKTIKNDLIV